MQKIKLFLDESGKYSLVSPEHFILTGVVIRQSNKTAVEGYFNYIKRKYRIPPNYPFHSFHIFENPSTKLTDSQLKNLAYDLADFIELIPIEVKIIEVKKIVFRNALGIKSDENFIGGRKNELKHFPYSITFAYMLEWFANFLAEEGCIGEVVADSRRTADKFLIDALDFVLQPECKIREGAKYVLKDKLSAIRFANKSYLSGGLELTDFISYITYFKVRSLLTQNKHIGVRRVWSSIREKNTTKKIYCLTKKEIQNYFNVDSDGVHKYLK